MRARRLVGHAGLAGIALGALWAGGPPPSLARTDGGEIGPRPGVLGARFALDGRSVFLLGASWYGGLGASQETLRGDMDALRQRGFNWVRVWATWRAFGEDVSAVDAEGRPRTQHLVRLKRVLQECGRRGMVVDVTISRGDGSRDTPRLASFDAHERAVRTLVESLRPFPNWMLDLANERNVGDARHVPFADLARLRTLVRRLDPARLVTASHGGDISRDELRRYLREAQVDFVCPHRPRHPGSPGQTEEAVRTLMGWMRTEGVVVPVHFQEPFRRGYADWNPGAADFLADLRGALRGGAAGWCLHNGAERGTPDGRPRRSFDLRTQALFAQLDPDERRVADSAHSLVADLQPGAEHRPWGEGVAYGSRSGGAAHAPGHWRAARP